MKPENELLAEETAFVNTCEKHAALLAIQDRGRHQFELNVYDPETGKRLASFGTYQPEPSVECVAELPHEVPSLTVEEFDKILETGTAELPPLPEPTLTPALDEPPGALDLVGDVLGASKPPKSRKGK